MKKKLPKLIRPVLIEGQDEPVQRPHADAPAAPAAPAAPPAPADYLRLVPTPAPDKPAAPVVQPVLASAPEAAPSKSSPRREEALKLVERFAFWAGAAGAIPVPILDITGVGAVQV